MAWLERHAPDVYQRILDADRVSAAAHDGHGNAIAQVYNHMILPLATRRDKVTQVRWGLADFRRRFGREPEGMWLPETAVDDETLEVLAEAGVKFTVLAPHQARRVRKLGDRRPGRRWAMRVDPSRPYLWRGPRGLTLALFFYDGPISRAIAFENALDRGENLVAPPQGRLRGWTRGAAARPLRHRRRVLRPPQEVRGHGAGRRDQADRDRGLRHAHQLRRLPRASIRRSGRPKSTRARRGAAPTAWNGGATTAAAGRAPTGTSAGGPLSARHWTGCATRSTCSTRRGPRPRSRIRGPRATPTLR